MIYRLWNHKFDRYMTSGKGRSSWDTIGGLRSTIKISFMYEIDRGNYSLDDLEIFEFEEVRTDNKFPLFKTK